METALDILKYILPSLVVLGTAYLLVTSFLNDERKKVEQLAQQTNQRDNRKEILALRLQAYERLTVFLERSHPNNLISRVIEGDMTAADLKYYLIETVKTEFEHNLSQQLYVSDDAWASVRFVKDDAIKTINLLSGSVQANTSGPDFAKMILEYYMQLPTGVPAQKALDIVNTEVKKLF